MCFLSDCSDVLYIYNINTVLYMLSSTIKQIIVDIKLVLQYPSNSTHYFKIRKYGALQ